MKILKYAIFGIVFNSFISVSANAFDLKKLTTKSGKVYHNIEILGSDKHGLLFRHSKGVAKESFPFLSASLREMFAPVGEVPAGKGGGAKELPTDKAGSDQHRLEGKAFSGKGEAVPNEVVLSLLVRQPVVHNPYAGYSQFNQLHPNPGNWPSHWHRFHPAHYLTNPLYREQATRNFLHATGLLPRPCGVGHYSGNTHFAGSHYNAPIRVVRPPIRRFY